MKRLALLIAHPGEPGDENYLAVDKDVIGWKSHLTSPIGGLWLESEIRVLMSPSRALFYDEVEKWRDAVDYAFIVFSGHGEFSAVANDTILQLNSSESIPSRTLHLAQKETIILDCCRKVRERYLLKSAVFESAAAETKLAFPHPELARLAFNSGINRCAEGVLVLHSCDINEFAYDDDFGRGGAYSHALIKTAAEWQPRDDVDTGKYLPYSVVAAHNHAVSALNEGRVARQNPQIRKPRSAPYFPISVWV